MRQEKEKAYLAARRIGLRSKRLDGRIGEGGGAGQLQGADPGDDGPAFLDGNRGAITAHQAFAVGDGVVNRCRSSAVIRGFGIGEAGGMEIGDIGDAVLVSDAFAVAGLAVADGAIDVVALLPEAEESFIHFDLLRESVAPEIADPARVDSNPSRG